MLAMDQLVNVLLAINKADTTTEGPEHFAINMIHVKENPLDQ